MVNRIKKSVMIYCDAVESTIVGSQRHSLLRKVELERKGDSRATIEPLHREWIRVRNQHVESIEVSLATPDGNLLVLPPPPPAKQSSPLVSNKYKRDCALWDITKTATTC